MQNFKFSDLIDTLRTPDAHIGWTFTLDEQLHPNHKPRILFGSEGDSPSTELTDFHVGEIRYWLSKASGIEVATDELREAIRYVATRAYYYSFLRTGHSLKRAGSIARLCKHRGGKYTVFAGLVKD